MARDVHGKGNGDAYHLSYLFKIKVYTFSYILICITMLGCAFLYDWEEKFALVGGITVYDLLHFFCPCYDELLAGLPAAVGDVSIPKVAFL